jgi:pimeloyl-ACP methyl ester carboxylesterase
MRLASALSIVFSAWMLAGGDPAAIPRAAIPAASARASGLQRGVVFTAYTPLTRSVELARRMLTPLTYRKLLRAAAGPGHGLKEQPVDLAHERFTIYVPHGSSPATGYGVLIFVPPWSQPVLPAGWSAALDRRHFIFVSAANSGNEASVYDRRVPLAVLAYENIRRLYPVDPQRVFVGGMSGGSRAALMAALAYPDIFRGVLLNSGSDVLGERGIRLPPAELFHLFQESTRLAYATGARDEFNVHADLLSQNSMRSWCVFNLWAEVVPRLAHEVIGSEVLERALAALERPAAEDSDTLQGCRAKVGKELSSELSAARTAIARGDRSSARTLIDAIDGHFGGLGAPDIGELDAAL